MNYRTRAGLTQHHLARKVGTSHSVISRIEDGDYQGHSLALLRRVAAALGKRVEIRFVDESSTGTRPRLSSKRTIRTRGTFSPRPPRRIAK